MANINATVRRFESGGTLTFASDTVLNIMPGTLEFTPPKRAALPFTDRGSQQTPLDGDEELGSLKCTLRAAYGDTVNVMTTWCTAPAASANATTYTLTVKVPDYKGAATGKVATLTACFFTKAPDWKAGTDFDTIAIEMAITSWTGWAAY